MELNARISPDFCIEETWVVIKWDISKRPYEY
jgi:hypothetical protein